MKRKGSIYEQKFFSKALEHGLEVFVPLGDYLPQDCLVMNSAGKIFKVQIKGTEAKSKDKARGGLGRYMVTTSRGSGAKDSIDCTKVDILVAYIECKNIFYNIPCIELDGAKRISVYPHNPESRAKHEKFKDNWKIFRVT
jgi:hypothetical protein